MKIIITGGAGFIGVNLALAHAAAGDKVVALDNLSRRGSEVNRELLDDTRGISFYKADVRDNDAVKRIFARHRDASLVYHLAAQVAVTTSVVEPREDFEINALGTFNALEAVRTLGMPAAFFYSSTNKVYGGMENEKIILGRKGYRFSRFPRGISEDYPTDFHSPYGCSKGAADQYVRDYGRMYGIRTVVFRQSCIYGINQFGVEDQGWIVHFVIRALEGKSITIYGNGHQVRDALYIEDLLDLYRRAYSGIKKSAGRIFNAGGGAENTVSIGGFAALLEKFLDRKIKKQYAPWRPGDQKIFVSDNSLATSLLGWRPRVSVEEGLRRVIDWVAANRAVIDKAMRCN